MSLVLLLCVLDDLGTSVGAGPGVEEHYCNDFKKNLYVLGEELVVTRVLPTNHFYDK